MAKKTDQSNQQAPDNNLLALPDNYDRLAYGTNPIAIAVGYECPKHETDLVHALIWRPGFNSQTGKLLNNPYPQKFNVQEFEDMKTMVNATTRRYDATGFQIVKILHAPDMKAASSWPKFVETK